MIEDDELLKASNDLRAPAVTLGDARCSADALHVLRPIMEALW